MKFNLKNGELEYYNPSGDKNCVFIQGRTKNSLIKLPDEWEEFVDLSSITVHLTPIGSNQNLVIKRVQGLEVHIQTNGLPVDCYYLIFATVLDTHI